MGRPIFSPGKEWAGPFFPGEKIDWGEIPACYTGSCGRLPNLNPISRAGNAISCILKFAIMTPHGITELFHVTTWVQNLIIKRCDILVSKYPESFVQMLTGDRLLVAL